MIPVLYQAMDRVSRELVGLIPSVSQDFSAERVAKDQTVRSPVVPASPNQDIVPGTDPGSSEGDANIGHVDLTISKSKRNTVKWNGNEQLGLKSGGQYERIAVDRFAQSMRALVNEVEVDIGGLYKRTSRAFGTAGTTPFASDLKAIAQLQKILDDNGAPNDGERFVAIDTTAAANLLSIPNMIHANEAGTDDTLRRGVLLDIFGFGIRKSAGIATHSAGTGDSFVLDGAHQAGDTVITVTMGTGTILEGDVVTIGEHKYVVTTALSGGSFEIAEPGLRANAADTTAVTLSDSYTGNIAFHRSSLHLATRHPAMPEEGDEAKDVMEITDPVSGLSFQVAMYGGYREIRYEVGLAWGMQGMKTEHAALLLG
ncbi:MAG: hypothetical protein WD492_12890 [Alkalispirochaeta sp.]